MTLLTKDVETRIIFKKNVSEFEEVLNDFLSQGYSIDSQDIRVNFLEGGLTRGNRDSVFTAIMFKNKEVK